MVSALEKVFEMIIALYVMAGYVGVCLAGYWFCLWFVDDEEDS